ncbi:MAG TPA: alpha/beta hydrolase domain-containing protein [Usitatibacter sp.]|jgi:hypothetical protein|nr:alpha/beta hydrolase domain-containing protein [Usitatibacter sp.]
MRNSEFRRKALAHGVACALAATSLLAAGDAAARVVRIVPDGAAAPAFGGASFGTVGTYERLTGMAYGELDPNDPKNAVIVDLALAPRNARGMVEYSFNYYILKPTNPALGNQKLMYEPPNRGTKLFGGFAGIAGGNDPASDTAPSPFLMNQGYAMAWSGWDAAAGAPVAGNFKAGVNLPTATQADGSAITGPSYEYFTGNGGTSLALTYPPANAADKSTAQLTHRVHLDDTPQVVDASTWNYAANGKSITLSSGNFTANDIYEFMYTAKNPTVNGVGFAAVRDFNSFLRSAATDDSGTPNPLAGHVTRIYSYTLSQPARLLNDFRHLGFNQDEAGHKVFDGMLQWIGAGDGINMNLRFSQTGRTERNRQDELYAEGVFPMSNVVTTDAITGKTDGRLVRCTATNTCPLAMEIYSANEYWVKAASLLHTTPDGLHDLGDSPYARNYFISSHQHGVGNGTSKGSCQQLGNPLDSSTIQRALFVDLDQWATNGVAPPPSAVPRLDNGTLVNHDQASVGFPHIPGVTFTGLKTTRYRYNYGPRFDQGIMDIDPPLHFSPYEDNPANGPIYPSWVPKTDSDGNDIAGIRLPAVSAPLATYTGWSLRSGPQANDGCEGSGQMVPFAATKAERLASGDPRPSIEERYPNHGAYVSAVAKAVNDLHQRRLLTDEDAEAYKDAASASSIGKK